MALTVKEILNMPWEDVSRLSEKNLRSAVTILDSAGNKRLKRMEQSGIKSQASSWVERSGGNFSVAGKNYNELRSEFKRVSGFLKAKTSTQKGYEEVRKNEARLLGVDDGKAFAGDKEERIFWEAYHMFMETDQGLVESVSYGYGKSHLTFLQWQNKTTKGVQYKSAESLLKHWFKERGWDYNAYKEAKSKGEDYKLPMPKPKGAPSQDMFAGIPATRSDWERAPKDNPFTSSGRGKGTKNKR